LEPDARRALAVASQQPRDEDCGRNEARRNITMNALATLLGFAVTS
jgi:hypothetical protein